MGSAAVSIDETAKALVARCSARARVASGAMWLNAAVHAVHAAFVVRTVALFAGEPADMSSKELQQLVDTAKSLDEAASVLLVVSIVALVVGGVAFLSWLAAAHRAADRLRPAAQLRTPRTAVFSFLIPIVNLVFPIVVLAALNRASDAGDVPAPAAKPLDEPSAAGYREAAAARASRVDAPRGAPVVAWGVTWVLSSIVALATRAMAAEPTSFARIREVAWTALAADVLCVTCALLAALVVEQIADRLRARAARLAALA